MKAALKGQPGGLVQMELTMQAVLNTGHTEVGERLEAKVSVHQHAQCHVYIGCLILEVPSEV